MYFEDDDDDGDGDHDDDDGDDDDGDGHRCDNMGGALHDPCQQRLQPSCVGLQCIFREALRHNPVFACNFFSQIVFVMK